jgi:anti-sigma factor RsiW
MQEVDAPGCGRENDLVAFLYGELDDIEKASFDNHRNTCHLCQAQTVEFRSIRDSVTAWRDESLGRAFLAAPARTAVVDQRKNSGLAALRAFFDLSPLWMKCAVGFAAILFCIFSGLTFARLRNAPSITASSANQPSYSQQELNALVEKRVQEELARRHVDQESATMSLQTSIRVKDNTVSPRPVASLNQGNQIALDNKNVKARRPLSKAEREQLAADLRLVSSGNERGVDLVDDQINQP